MSNQWSTIILLGVVATIMVVMWLAAKIDDAQGHAPSGKEEDRPDGWYAANTGPSFVVLAYMKDGSDRILLIRTPLAERGPNRWYVIFTDTGERVPVPYPMTPEKMKAWALTIWRMR